MSKELTLILFYVALAAGILLRITAMVFYVTSKRVKVNMTPYQAVSMLEKDQKSIYRVSPVYKIRRTPFYAYSEGISIQSGEITLNCEEDDNSLYNVCAAMHRCFVYRSASVKRAHFNFSWIMSGCIGIFSVVSLVLVLVGRDSGDSVMMTNAMLIYLITFLCSVITADFDIASTVDCLIFIKNNNVFGVNYYYARRVFMGYVCHKISRAAAVILFPASIFIGMLL